MRLILIAIFVINIFAQEVLILNSYRQSFAWTKGEVSGILDTIKKSNIKINYYIEDMNTKVFRPTLQREKNILCYLSNKYKNIKFDAIVVTDDNAINFVRKFKNEKIFKDAKVFFGGVNNLKLKDMLDKNIYAGLFEKKDPLKNLYLAKKLKPNLKTIYLISDNSVSANKVLENYKQAFDKIKGINFIYLNHKEFSIIAKKLNKYDKNSVMMALTYGSMFENNEKIKTMEVLYKLSKIYHNPIIIHASSFAYANNSNVIGGYCSDAYSQGQIPTQMMIRYFNGEKMNNLGFKFKGNRYYINVKNLLKFGLSPKDLDIKNPILVNNEFSFYEKNKLLINSMVIIFILVVIFLIILAKKNQKLQELAQNFNVLFHNSLELNVIFDFESGNIVDINEYGIKVWDISQKIIF